MVLSTGVDVLQALNVATAHGAQGRRVISSELRPFSQAESSSFFLQFATRAGVALLVYLVRGEDESRLVPIYSDNYMGLNRALGTTRVALFCLLGVTYIAALAEDLRTMRVQSNNTPIPELNSADEEEATAMEGAMHNGSEGSGSPGGPLLSPCGSAAPCTPLSQGYISSKGAT